MKPNRLERDQEMIRNGFRIRIRLDEDKIFDWKLKENKTQGFRFELQAC